jgi:hypothetical protein
MLLGWSDKDIDSENREYAEKIKVQSTTFWLKPLKLKRKETGRTE